MRIVDNYLTNKKIQQYRDEAEAILEYAETLKGMEDWTLVVNFTQIKTARNRPNMLLAYAIITEVIQRKLKLSPYVEQIMGALAMGDGHIVEMATGEGKTLAAAYPLAWHALFGRSHCITANDYLARRDSEFLHPVYQTLHLNCDYLQENFGRETRQLSYRRQIVYGTASQFVFDYLRDNTALDVQDLIQQGNNFALIDEADSILIDEARTPFLLSGEVGAEDDQYQLLDELARSLEAVDAPIDVKTKLDTLVTRRTSDHGDCLVDIRGQAVSLTERGFAKAEAFLIERGIVAAGRQWMPEEAPVWAALFAALKAHYVFQKDRDYVVSELGEVITVDPETGRLSPGRRWNQGIHQAVECKEGLEVKGEAREIGRIALASYLDVYDDVAGMSGTAVAVADELHTLYGLKVIPIPRHLPSKLVQHPDKLFATKEAKFNEIADDVEAIHKTTQPILVGTGSIEDSEALSKLFHQRGLHHRVLNAKQNLQEALIIAEAGKPKAITIATNMAGRGTDILLGGSAEHSDAVSEQLVLEQGGLFVIGAERMDSARLDQQLAGRAGRQGDPGHVRFYASLEDALLRQAGAKHMAPLFRFAANPDAGLQGTTISRALKRIQKQKQSMTADARRAGLAQDRLLDEPRGIFLTQRDVVLRTDAGDLLDDLDQVARLAAHRLMSVYSDATGSEGRSAVLEKIKQWHLSPSWAERAIHDYEKTLSVDDYAVLIREFEQWLSFELTARSRSLLEQEPKALKQSMLLGIDTMWQSIVEESDRVRQGVSLQAYVGVKPHLALKQSIYQIFHEALADVPVAQLDYFFEAIEQHALSLEAA
ncbi:preprotein translocase subunit SecA [Pseudomonas nitritireducens]|uniref:Protein translocase subunit SecA n=1 Tax=Pseudomonas nitroreducens TaxID=46680 RepID=A0A7W7NZL0_PSENT|nr:hypothetical protein [Pseudomonas nitritireducens]MBB4861322.1 preprotein translocase subunit SecA [Pseudomonas nitritireducens]